MQPAHHLICAVLDWGSQPIIRCVCVRLHVRVCEGTYALHCAGLFVAWFRCHLAQYFAHCCGPKCLMHLVQVGPKTALQLGTGERVKIRPSRRHPARPRGRHEANVTNIEFPPRDKMEFRC